MFRKTKKQESISHKDVLDMLKQFQEEESFDKKYSRADIGFIKSILLPIKAKLIMEKQYYETQNKISDNQLSEAGCCLKYVQDHKLNNSYEWLQRFFDHDLLYETKCNYTELVIGILLIDSILKIDSLIKLTGTNQSRNDVIENAVDFYFGYITSQLNQDYLCGVFGTKMEGLVSNLATRISKGNFRTAVEMDMHTRMLASVIQLNKNEYDKLRIKSIHDVKATNGSIDILEATDSFENGL